MQTATKCRHNAHHFQTSYRHQGPNDLAFMASAKCSCTPRIIIEVPTCSAYFFLAYTCPFIFGECSVPNSSSIHLRMMGSIAGSPMCIAFGMNLQQKSEYSGIGHLYSKKTYRASFTLPYCRGIIESSIGKISSLVPYAVISFQHQEPEGAREPTLASNNLAEGLSRMRFSTSENRLFPSFFISSKLPYPNFSARHSARLRHTTHQLLCSSTKDPQSSPYSKGYSR